MSMALFYGSFYSFLPLRGAFAFCFSPPPSLRRLSIYIYLIGWSSFLTITACRKNGYEIIFIVGNSH